MDEVVGAGELEELLALPDVTDVLVTAPDEVWVDRGAGLERATVRFADEQAVLRLAFRLAALASRRLDDAQPFVDAVLGHGVRLHAVLPPLAAHTTISLRSLRRGRFDLAELERLAMFSVDVGVLLRAVVAARLAVVISGATGTGKTTMLAALLSEVEPTERIVVIEDTAELCIAHPHVVRMLTRPPNIEGSGGIGPRELVRQALRMRPDRIVVGEFRGPEIVDLLLALTCGHEGGAATVHAGSSAQVPQRCAALGALAGAEASAVAHLVATGLDVVVHLVRRGGRRIVTEVGLIVRGNDAAEVLPVWSEARGRGPAAPQLAERIAERGVPPPSWLW